MAEFNPPGPEGGQTNFLSRSGGPVRKNTAGELLTDLAGIGEAAVRGYDFTVQQEIEDQVKTAVDYTRNYYGVDAAADASAPSLIPENYQPPEELANSYEWLDELFQGYESGAFSETHYYGQLQAVVRGLRQRYPGYDDEIDTMVSRLTGVTPANALISSLRNDAEANMRAANEAFGDTLDLVRENMGLLQNAFNTHFANDPQFAGMEYGMLTPEEQVALYPILAPYIARSEGLRWSVEQQRYLREGGQQTAWGSWNTVFNEAVSSWTGLVEVSLAGAGLEGGIAMANLDEYGNFIEYLMQNGLAESDEDAARILEDFNRELVIHQSELTQLITESGLEGEDLSRAQAQIDNHIETYQRFLETLHTGEWNQAAILQSRMDLRSTRGMAVLTEAFPNEMMLFDIIELLPAAARDSFWNSVGTMGTDGISTFTASLVDLLGTPDTVLSAAGASREQLEAVGNFRRIMGNPSNWTETVIAVTETFEDNVDAQTQGDLLYGVATEMVDAIIDPTAPAEDRERAITDLFGEDGEGGTPIEAWWQEIGTADDRRILFERLVSPEVSQVIAGIGGQDWNNYTTWVRENWNVVYDQYVVDLNRNWDTVTNTSATYLGTEYNLRDFVDVVYDSENGMFFLEVDDSYLDIVDEDALAAAMGYDDPTSYAFRTSSQLRQARAQFATFSNAIATLGDLLDPINRGFSLVANMMDANGEEFSIHTLNALVPGGLLNNEYTESQRDGTLGAPLPPETPPEGAGGDFPLPEGPPTAQGNEGTPEAPEALPEPTPPAGPIRDVTPTRDPDVQIAPDTRTELPPDNPFRDQPLEWFQETLAGDGAGFNALTPEQQEQFREALDFKRAESTTTINRSIQRGDKDVALENAPAPDRTQPFIDRIDAEPEFGARADALFEAQQQFGLGTEEYERVREAYTSRAGAIAEEAAFQRRQEAEGTFRETYDPRFYQAFEAEDVEQIKNFLFPSGMTIGNIVNEAQGNWGDNPLGADIEMPAGSVNTPVGLAQAFLGFNENDPMAAGALEAFFRTTTGSSIDPSEIAWCARFMKAVLLGSGYHDAAMATDMARSFMDIGNQVPFTEAQQGDVVVFWRENPDGPFGHVGLYLGTETIDGVDYVRTLGGNQGDSVSVSLYRASQLLGVRRLDQLGGAN